MASIVGGVLLAVMGYFLAFMTYKKWSLFWSSVNTRLLREYLGDSVTSTILYVLSMVFFLLGVLLAAGVVH